MQTAQKKPIAKGSKRREPHQWRDFAAFRAKWHCIKDGMNIDKRIAYLIQANEKENSPKSLDIRGSGEFLVLDVFFLQGRFRRNRPMSVHEILPKGANEKVIV